MIRYTFYFKDQRSKIQMKVELFNELELCIVNEEIENADELIQLLESHPLTPEEQTQLAIHKENVIRMKREHLLTLTEPRNVRINTVETLQQSANQLRECEQQAAETLQNLAVQEEKLRNMNQKAKHVNDQMSVSSRLLSKMSTWWRG